MSLAIPVTKFELAEREPIGIVRRQARALGKAPLDQTLLRKALNYVFILNERRQIVFASESCRALLSGKSLRRVLGRRPGELLGCIHATETPGGCGTAEACRDCGALRAILASLAGKYDMRHYRVTRLVSLGTETLDFKVSAIPFTHHDERFALFSFAETSTPRTRSRRASNSAQTRARLKVGGALVVGPQGDKATGPTSAAHRSAPEGLRGSATH